MYVYIPTYCMSTTYPPRLTPTYIIHALRPCPDAVLGATTPPAPPCRSEDYIDRRISSALFAPTFLALSPCPCKNAGLPFRRLRIDSESLPGSEVWRVSLVVVVKIPSSPAKDVGVGPVISLMHDHPPPPAQPGSTQQPQQALAALVCC